jgi:hypothetical protein
VSSIAHTPTRRHADTLCPVAILSPGAKGCGTFV